jgi:hypothetical protein
MINLEHAGEESKHNMWQKTRSIWAYIYEHYRADYDYFHLGGDDHFVIVENLRHFLNRVDQRTQPNEPVLLGQWVLQEGGSVPVVTGEAGYTLNRAAVETFAEKLLPVCRPFWRERREGHFISLCFREIGVFPGDTRDEKTGEQLYHRENPTNLFNVEPGMPRRPDSVLMGYYASMPHPSKPNTTVGIQTGLRMAGKYSVTFHNLRLPQALARAHAVLYRSCPRDSALAKYEEKRKEYTTKFYDAFSGDGKLGYVADPTSLRRERLEFLHQRPRNSTTDADVDLFTTLEHYGTQHIRSGDTPLNAEYLCSEAGSGLGEGGLQILAKIQIANVTDSPRILCVVYTYGKNRNMTRVAALTWGYKCDGFVAISTETIPELGIAYLTHHGNETLGNMWQKTRSILAYIYDNYLNDCKKPRLYMFDYVFLTLFSHSVHRRFLSYRWERGR